MSDEKENIQPLLESGKLKHERILQSTILAIQISGALMVSIIFNPTFPLGIHRSWILTLIGTITLGVLWFQTHRLNKLEEILGWDEKKEDGELNPIAKFLTKNIKPIFSIAILTALSMSIFIFLILFLTILGIFRNDVFALILVNLFVLLGASILIFFISMFSSKD